MSDTRKLFDPFLEMEVEISDKLTDRLRGTYAIGPIGPDGVPEFGWRQHGVPPIQIEAAAEIDRLNALVDGPYLVWSNEHRCWWRANSCGYTTDIRGAGIYTRTRAIEIATKARNGWSELDRPPDEIAVAIRDLPEAVRAAAFPLVKREASA